MKGSRTDYTSGFDPKIIPGLTVWLDAADRSTMTLSGTSVTQWRDKSGNAKHATGSGANAPVLSPASLNNLSTLRFNGASGTPQYVDLPSFDFGTSERSAFFVIQNTGPSTGAASVPHWFWPTTGNGTNSLSLTAWIGTAVQGQAGMIATTATKNAYLLFSYRFASAVEEVFYGGVSAGTATKTVNGSSYANATSGYRIGAIVGDVTTTYFFDGNIGEILLFNTAITTSQRQQIEGYLARKWGSLTLAATHPYVKIPPTLRPFAPIDISGCALWLDAADPATLTLSGSNVTAWADKSGNNRSVTVTGTPQLLAGGLNSTPVVTLTGGASYFTTSTATTIGTGDYLMGAVWSQTSNATSVPIGLEGGGGGAGIGWNVGGNYNLFEWASNEASIARTFSTAPVLQLGSRVSGSLSLRLNGTASTAVASSKNITGPAAFIGRYGNGGGPFPVTGYIAEVLIFTGPTTVEQRQQLEGYLARKWGLQSSVAVGHPYRFGVPALTVGFGPLAISGCALWLDAADQSTMTLSGSNVTQWNDKSGNGRNASTATGTLALSSNSLVFTGTQAMTTSLTTVATTQTVFAVTSANTASYVDILGIDAPDGGPNGLQFNMSNFTQTLARFGGALVASGGSVSQNVTFLSEYTYISGGNTFLYLNGSQSGSNTTSPAISGSGTVVIGAYRMSATFNEFYNGRINEVLIYHRVLTTIERQQVEGYLAWKWNLQSRIPTNHPYRLLKT